ncbi:MAG: hypothetical protein ACPGYT_11400 [Nitrospirales bacterium]
MSKVYEALLHARAERLQTNIPEPETTPKASPFVPSALPSSATTSPNLEQEMLILDQSLAELTKHMKGPILQFMGLHENAGTSTIVREFAKLWAARKRKSVMIIDAYRDQPQYEHFGLNSLPSLEQSFQEERNLSEAIHHVGTTQMFISSLYSPLGRHRSGNAIPAQESIFASIRHRFDTILIDTPPISTSIDGLSLCKQVDGVVLVIEAEKSRSAVIQHVKDRIIKGGGTLLGLVFNKQHHYIPKRVYQWL